MNKKLIASIFVLILLVSGIVYAPDFDFDGSETKEIGDWTWTSSQISKIKVMKNGYLGESNDGYRFYRAKDPNDNIGVIRVKPDADGADIAFAKGEIGKTNLKSYLDAEAFRVVEIQGSSGWYWFDDVLETEDLSTYYTGLKKQIDESYVYKTPIVWQGTKTTRIEPGITPSSKPTEIKIPKGDETAETDIPFTPAEINTGVIYENGYVGKSEEGFEFFRGEMGGKKGVFRVKLEEDDEEVSFAPYHNPAEITTENIGAMLLVTEKVQDIEIQGSSGFAWLDDDLITKDLLNYGRTGDSLLDGFNRAKSYAIRGGPAPALPTVEKSAEISKIQIGQTISLDGLPVAVAKVDILTGIVTILDETGQTAEINLNEFKKQGGIILVAAVPVSGVIGAPGSPDIQQAAIITKQTQVQEQQDKVNALRTAWAIAETSAEKTAKLTEWKTEQERLEALQRDLNALQGTPSLQQKQDAEKAAAWKITIDGREYEFKTKTEAENYIKKLPAHLKAAVAATLKQGKAIPSEKVEAIEIKMPDGTVKYDISVGGKIVKTGLTQAEKDIQINALKREQLEKAIAKDTRYTSLGFSAGDDTSTKIVKGTDDKFSKAYVDADGKVKYTLLTEAEMKEGYRAKAKIGNAEGVPVVFELKAGEEPKIRSVLGMDVDESILAELNRAAKGEDMSIRLEANKLIVINTKTKFRPLEIEIQKEKKILTHNTFLRGKTVKISSTETTADTRTEKNYEPVFYDSDGNIVKDELAYADLIKEQKQGEIKSFIKFETKYEGVDEKGKPTIKELIQYDSTYGLDFEKGKGTLEFRDKYIYDEKGKFKEYVYIYYDKDGKPTEIKFDDKGNAITKDAGIKKQAESAKTKANSRMWFSAFEYAFTELTGLSAYSSLFFSKEDLSEWRESVDKVFDNVILGGTDYWTSEICKSQYDKSIDGVAYAVTPSGMLEAVAHIEAERSSEIIIPGNPSQYLYKITFYVKASEEDVSFNVKLYGDKTTQIFSRAMLLKGDEDGDGEEYSATDKLAIVQYSSNFYDVLCLEFYQGDIEGTCNRIAQSEYSRDNYIESGSSGGANAGAAVSKEGEEKITIRQI